MTAGASASVIDAGCAFFVLLLCHMYHLSDILTAELPAAALLTCCAAHSSHLVMESSCDSVMNCCAESLASRPGGLKLVYFHERFRLPLRLSLQSRARRGNSSLAEHCYCLYGVQ